MKGGAIKSGKVWTFHCQTRPSALIVYRKYWIKWELFFTNDNKYTHLGGSGAFVSYRAIRTPGTLHKKPSELWKCVLYRSWGTFHLNPWMMERRVVQHSGNQDNNGVTVVTPWKMATNPTGDSPSLLHLNHNTCKSFKLFASCSSEHFTFIQDVKETILWLWVTGIRMKLEFHCKQKWLQHLWESSHFAEETRAVTLFFFINGFSDPLKLPKRPDVL